MDWGKEFAHLIGLQDSNYGLLTFTVFSFFVGAFVLIITRRAFLFGRNQFRIANTIKYLEEFRSSRFKRIIDRVRKGDVENGRHWRVYGLMGGVVELVHAKTVIPVPRNEARIAFAIEAKYISHYFDYAAMLIKRKHIDSDLFFQQLCEVVIDNWKFLQPYIYYQRLARFDRFAREHASYYEEALTALKSDASIPAETIEYLSSAVLALKALEGLPATRLPEHSGPGIHSADDLTALDDQMWFEGLYVKALEWRSKRRTEKRQYAPPDQIKHAIIRVGANAIRDPASGEKLAGEPPSA